ncbi:5-oxoprolinase subunit PxpB [Candidatus Colwellia aromaticivorans]|uniref:5-oxoprolinase subunit PxpB n=1 Tax=Candidatus Colwellia aromaticivorans TaxID=2267621 RepID=UPI001B34C9E5|nr:5-oxoprolinase subunit PxpB [Candidatus Colwellia aromaticivorans]
MLENINIHIAGENALIVYFSEQGGGEVNANVSAKVQQAEQLIRKAMEQELAHDIIDLVASYASLMVMFNMMSTDHHQIRNKLRTLLQSLNDNSKDQCAADEATIVELPVYYSHESGPDLSVIAQRAQLTVEQVIEIHQVQEYRVYAIGFAPGFAYLGEVDERIAAPRLSTPRMKVPKGAVAIADRQTAVYPSVSPGGWNIIGLCPINMFDAKASPTMPVKVGDRVKFKAISKDEFLTLGGVLEVSYE